MVAANEGAKAAAEMEAASESVCRASLEAARGITEPLVLELQDPDSVLYAVVALRNSQLPKDAILGSAPGLLVHPPGIDINIARYRLQPGVLPEDAAASVPVHQLPLLWAPETATLPRLAVPEGAGDRVMAVADRLQMRGGGPTIFAREEVRQMRFGPNTKIKISAAARNASRQRVRSGLALLEAHPDYDQPIIATANPRRKLREDEHEVVKEFAPEAKNELELFIDSAIAEGFMIPEGERYGVRILGGDSYKWMHHPNGAKMLVLAPELLEKEDGTKQTGLYNGYQSLLMNGTELLGESFQLEGSDMIYITSTHYGTMAIVNNLVAVHGLRTNLNSFQVLGDNQPARTPQAHLIEVGLTLEGARKATEESVLKAALIESAASA